MKRIYFIVPLIVILLSCPLFAQSPEAVTARNEGYRLYQEGKLNEAIAAYQKAISLDQNYAAPHNDLGIVYEELNQRDKAEKEYLLALKLDPNYVGVYSNLAALYEANGDTEAALYYWKRRAAMGDPGDEWRKKAAGKVQQLSALLDKKQTTAARATAAASSAPRAVSVSKPSVSRSISQARSDIRQHRYQEAISTLEAAKQYSKNPSTIDSVLYDARDKAIEYEMIKASQESSLYKKEKLLEVEKAWYPPQPEPNAGAIPTGAQAMTAKSPARVLLEKKANQIIPSIDFTDARLKDVVEYLAGSNDINIVIDESVVTDVSGVTVHLKNIPLIQALDIILRTKGLKYRFEDNIIWITTAEKLAEEDLVVRVYDVQDLVGKLQDFPSTPFNISKQLENTGTNNNEEAQQ